MALSIESVIGKELSDDLHREFEELVSRDDASMSDLDQLLYDYGLEPDYLEELLF